MGKKEFFLDGLKGAHEARFESASSKLLPKKIAVPQFNKQSRRDSLLVKDAEIIAYVDDPPPKERTFGYPSEPIEPKPEKKYQKVLIPGRLQYNPNYDTVKSKLNIGVPKFEKMK
jgi:hypothetical protein